MSRRWIRIDRAHRTFDCSPGEFAAMLLEARAEEDFSGMSRDTLEPEESDLTRIEANDFQLQEAINAELALLANLQRRERILKSELQHASEAQDLAKLGQILADQHAESLQNDQSRPR